MAAVLEYICGEILEAAGDVAKSSGTRLVLPDHITTAVQNDRELAQLLLPRGWDQPITADEAMERSRGEWYFSDEGALDTLMKQIDGVDISLSREARVIMNYGIFDLFTQLSNHAVDASDQRSVIESVHVEAATCVSLFLEPLASMQHKRRKRVCISSRKNSKH